VNGKFKNVPRDLVFVYFRTAHLIFFNGICFEIKGSESNLIRFNCKLSISHIYFQANINNNHFLLFGISF
jgi:hypothetical protein